MERWWKVFGGCLLMSAGILMFKYAHITTGGVAGLALNLAYVLQLPFDGVFFAVNVPFYFLAWRRLGGSFTALTVLCVLSVSCLAGAERLLPALMLSPWLGALGGGLLAGLGLSCLFMGRSSLGGTGVVTVYLQQRYGWDPGKINFCFDALIVASGALVVGLEASAFSALSIVMVSSVLSLCRRHIARSYTPAAPRLASSGN